jgi:hypothetical protein
MNITSKIVALSSAVAFALQIALALLMLRYFSPEEVGMFSVISQIGFFWTTLALAQTPLRLLANHGASVFEDAQHAWVSSLQRLVWLSPVAALAVWWSGLSFVNALLWALLLSLCQLTWMLAQSMRLRMEGVWAQAGVRVLPPMVALLVATAAVFVQWSGPALFVAALLGYAIGAAWLLPALLFSGPKLHDASHVLLSPIMGDDRSATLRMAHTLFDALLAMSIVVMWQRLYGEQETGWMASTLRLIGFVPAVISMAGSQVMLAKPQISLPRPFMIGICGFICVSFLASCCYFACKFGLLDIKWQGLTPYLLPIVIWQGCSCIAAAYSYLPFQMQKAKDYSFICIGGSILQGLNLLAPIWIFEQLSAILHMYWYAISYSIVLLTICWIISKTHSKQIQFNKI